MSLIISASDRIEENEVVHLYKENKWLSAEKPAQLLAALRNSHSLVTAHIDGQLVGLANAISDGHLVVYFPHMLVLPKMQRQGIGQKIMQTMIRKYSDFHQLMLTADGAAVDFYKELGFSKAGQTEPLWIYHGNDH